MRFYWVFTGETTVADLPGMPNAVVRVEAQLHATDDAGADVAMGVAVDMEPDSDGFKEFSSITVKNLAEWMEANADPQEIMAKKYLLEKDVSSLSRTPVEGRRTFKKLLSEVASDRSKVPAPVEASLAKV